MIACVHAGDCYHKRAISSLAKTPDLAREVLQAIADRTYAIRRNDMICGPLFDEHHPLAKKHGSKVFLRVMVNLVRAEYIEYGVSMRTGWITPEGEAVLAKAGV